MLKINDLVRSISKLDSEIEVIKGKRMRLISDANELCPVKVGDIIQSKNVECLKGKLKVNHIHFYVSFDNWALTTNKSHHMSGWFISGRAVLVNGDIGVRRRYSFIIIGEKS